MSNPKNLDFHLFGYPIAHSAAPSFQNHVFSALDSGNTFSIWSTTKITEEMLATIKSSECGGAAVTMPIKATIIPYLDELSLESQLTGACNTIVKIAKSEGGFKLVGQNTDILGVRNSLLRSLRFQHPGFTIHSEASYPAAVKGAGLIIGGGATTRSAAQALTLLGLSPIFLINRDTDEVRAITEAMPHLAGGLIHLRNPEDVELYLAGNDSPVILMAVGCIPAISPSNYAERLVYATTLSVLTLPYVKPTAESVLPIPKTRLFLEMPYKPQRTPMLKMADAFGWDVIIGVQAMIEQGLAQQRMWKAGVATVQVGSDSAILGSEIEESARKLVNEMKDIVPVGKEIDRAERNESASFKCGLL